MELKFKTTELQDMVGKAIKCSSNNKLIPLTSLMSIKVEDNVLTLTTTDATNYFYVSKVDKVDCENFEISVLADLFTKLVQKTTSADITLNFDGNTLKVMGNGTYTMELPLDENGNPIKFPKKLSDDFRTDAGIIKVSTIQNIINSNKTSLAISVELPSLTCYYCGDNVVTSDRTTIVSTGIKMFDNPMLISAPLMELLGIVSGEDIKVTTSDSDIVFTTSTETVYSPITEGIETFPIDAIMGLANSPFKANCTVPRQAVLNVIDRLSLFVSPYDKKGIYLTFTKDGIMFSSKKSSGTELVPFVSSNDFIDYTCCIDIDMLKNQVSTQDSDNIELYYGSDIAIKMVNNNITQVVALAEDDRTNG